MRKQNRLFLLPAILLAVIAASGRSAAADIPNSALVQPEELAKILQKNSATKPLIFQVGFQKLYQQARIPGAEYVGAASQAEGIQQLEKRVASLPKNKAIVLYCGCCPWWHCPNVQPAYQLLHSMGFTNVKVLYIAQNFGADWVSKGYPTEKGE
ncbi:MAG TPA: rhodanese-like domain-containing protein [Terriglobales bacterium]|nr:rhodanese-like domain-containing protein [Terriglobales bacterium]